MIFLLLHAKLNQTIRRDSGSSWRKKKNVRTVLCSKMEKQMMSDFSLSKISNILKNEGGKEIFLFGSHATGHANENSDIDIGVKGLLSSKFMRTEKHEHIHFF